MFVVLFFPLLLARETACKREKKAFFIPRMMNSNSSSWASYCSSASDFLPIEESGAACFAELLLKFCCFQLNIEAAVSALIRPLVVAPPTRLIKTILPHTPYIAPGILYKCIGFHF